MQLHACQPGRSFGLPPDQAADGPSTRLLAVASGTVTVAWRNRGARIDEDAYLPLGGGQPCTIRGGGDAPAILVTVDLGGDAPGGADLAENLRPRDGDVGTMLRALLADGDAGASSSLALAVRDDNLALRRRAALLGAVKPATRDELLRRVLRAADFILSHHEEALTLDDMARAASLSRFHFARLFGLVHGETPRAFLLRKRTAVARRHLAVGGAASDAAARAGFGCRTTLFRHLRKGRPQVSERFEEGTASCCRSA